MSSALARMVTLNLVQAWFDILQMSERPDDALWALGTGSVALTLSPTPWFLSGDPGEKARGRFHLVVPLTGAFLLCV